ncbi:MAG: endonuclease/exonuclease/phosphatase family protein [Acidimicrobiia bacterium]|nr:endonuclease/exonuclease/phosphatase family protein [Acidimicrobiia bacterium]MDH3397113.1 endonuclease/exonuclease/phosphatase family protein [Acidimicrobiia bacterium]MDH5615512.1 endonuclease/exonuclease/phosphatase family protein [Acidimicrobiia bacterium]
MNELHRPGRTLRILTANLYAERLDVGGFRELLKDLDLDVAVVQELSFAAAEVLGGVLPYGMLVPEEGHDGRGLALKAPAEMERLPMTFRDGLIARLEPPEWPGSLEIINIHMANPIMWPPWQSVRSRGRQLGVLLAHLGSPGSRLVAGDFNASPAWPVYRRLAARLDDAAVLVTKERGGRPVRTWGPTPSMPRLLRIDHVFVEGLRPLDTRRVTIPGSDHSGLLVEVDLG